MSGTVQQRTSPGTIISAEDAVKLEALLTSSRAHETRRSYTSALRTFVSWCHERGYPAHPTTPDVVAAFIAHRANSVSHSTISRDVAAISAAHLDSGLEDPTAHHGVRLALRSVGRSHGTAPSRRAAPVTTDAMRLIIEAMDDLHTAVGKRDRAILLIGLAAAQRRSEVADLTTKDLTRLDTGLLVRIRRSKTDQTGKGDVIGVPLGEHPETCPVLAVEDWLEASGRRIGDGSPLFSRIFSHASIAKTKISDRSIARIIQARATAAGITGKEYSQVFGTESWVSGHSLRAGHATSAAEAGLDPMTIARTTRHRRLDSLSRYVRPASAVDDSTAGKIGL
ncbi:site-specific integrase [Brachybacterium sp. ACRRE]|uniref:site-specific integrase n=1 Tax=Brachybacterium sp. ACRRE TaxID=2918184 RepID=UPI001EF1637F|nr:site-specific integrase [Brachybacterium sp. ACRRE]MCG7308274.1 tyrosine-type recombinase/integrase [Brachybacterium sp. ACRRE]